MAFEAPHLTNGGAGVWGLKEFPTGSTVTTSIRNEMLGCLTTPNVAGFCARIHIDQLFPSNNGVLVTTFMDQLWNVVNDASVPTANRKMNIRVITGRYTPAYVFDSLGARGYTASGGNGRAPDACKTDGTPNTAYINWIVDCMSKIADWMRAKGPGRCPILHWSWFSNQYSEFYHGPELRSPFTGYDVGNANFIAASNLLVDAAYAESDSNLTCSFGMSGTHTEDVQVGIIEHMDSLAGEFSGRLMFTANGLSDTGWWGATTESTQCSNCGIPTFGGTWNPPNGRRVTHGGQDIQPGNYPVAYRTAQCSGLINGEADIWEIYTNDGGTVGAPGLAFTGSNSAGLRVQIDRFVASLGAPPPPPPPPPTITNIIPTSGIVGSTVTILGTNFTGATQVRFNGTLASFTINSSTNIVATVPSGASTGFITVQTPNGTATSGPLRPFTVTGGPTTATLGKVVVTHQARTLTPIGGDPGTVLTPVVAQAVAQPGPAWTGLDGKVYIATRPSAATRPKLYQVDDGEFTQISDASYEAAAIVPLNGSTDEDGRVVLGTQGTGLLVGTSQATPPPPPGGDGSALRIQIAPGNGPLEIVPDGDWVDIGADGMGMVISGGRQHELATSVASTLNLRLRNNEGLYTPSNTDSELAGFLVPMMPVRVVDDGFPMFYGFVEDWVQTWPEEAHAPNMEVVEVTAADGFGVLSAFDMTFYASTILADHPSCFWRFDEPNRESPLPNNVNLLPQTIVNHGEATDTGVTGASFNLQTYQGAPGIDPQLELEFAPGPFGTTTAIEFFGGNPVRPVQQGSTIRNAPTVWFAKAFEFWIWPQDLQDGDGLAAMGERFGVAENMSHAARYAWKLDITADGELVFGWTWTGALRTTTSPAGLLTSDGWQHIVVSIDEAEVSWYRNGVLFGTSLLPSGNPEFIDPLDAQNITVGFSDVINSATTGGPGFVGRLANFAVYPASLNLGQVTSHYAARGEGITEGYAGEQINKILDMVGWPDGLRAVDPGTTLMQAVSEGGSALEAILKIGEVSERGLVQIAPDGKFVFHDRDNMTIGHNVPLATYGDEATEIQYSTIRIPRESQDVYTVVKVNRENGLTVVATDAAGFSRYGKRVLEVTVGFASDDDIELMANSLLAQYSTPQYRPREVTLLGARGPEQLTQIRTRTTHGDRIRIIKRFPGVTDTLALEAQIEGRTLTREVGEEWKAVYNLTPAASAQAWVLGVSQIGIDTVMGW